MNWLITYTFRQLTRTEDGTRAGDEDTAMELSSIHPAQLVAESMMRVYHLDDAPRPKPGDMLRAMEVIGILSAIPVKPGDVPDDLMEWLGGGVPGWSPGAVGTSSAASGTVTPR